MKSKKITLTQMLADYALFMGISAAEAAPKLADELAEDFYPDAELSDEDYKQLVDAYCQLLAHHVLDADEIVRDENESAKEFAEARREGLAHV